MSVLCLAVKESVMAHLINKKNYDMKGYLLRDLDELY